MAKDKLTERLPMKMSKLVEHVSNKPLPAGKNYLIIEICANRMSDDEDVDVPYVKYTFAASK